MQSCREQKIPSSVFNGRCKRVTHERRKRAIEVVDDEEPEQIQLPLNYPDDIEVNLLILFMLKEINIFIIVCPFVFFFCGHYVVCSFSVYGFSLLLWYLQTLLNMLIRVYNVTLHIIKDIHAEQEFSFYL